MDKSHKNCYEPWSRDIHKEFYLTKLSNDVVAKLFGVLARLYGKLCLLIATPVPSTRFFYEDTLLLSATCTLQYDLYTRCGLKTHSGPIVHHPRGSATLHPILALWAPLFVLKGSDPIGRVWLRRA